MTERPASPPPADAEFLRECADVLGKLEAALERGDIRAMAISILCADGSEDYLAVRPIHNDTQALLGAMHLMAHRLTAWIEANTLTVRR